MLDAGVSVFAVLTLVLMETTVKENWVSHWVVLVVPFTTNLASTLDQSTIQNGAYHYSQNNHTDAYDNGLFGRYNLGFDYDLGKNQSLTAGVSFGTRNMTRYTRHDQQPCLTACVVLTSTTYRDVTTRDLSNNVDMLTLTISVRSKHLAKSGQSQHSIAVAT
jgi:hypothetical protein